MNSIASRARSLTACRGGRALFPLALAWLVAPPAAAQGSLGPEVWASTSSSLPAGFLPEVDDGSLVRIGATGDPELVHSEGHWLATAGFVPGDVDGLAVRPGAEPGHYASYAFSFLSNEGPFLDGDILGYAAGGGLEVVVSEDELATALGTPGAAIDVDAFTWDAFDDLVFSLQSDLAGTVVGDVSDGDVLRLDASGVVSIVLTEADVQAAFEAASGSTASIGDVQGLEWGADGPWLVVQSPSDYDGAILDWASATFVLDESQTSIGGAELDAVALLEPASDPGRLWMSSWQASPGDVLQARYAGGHPGAPMLVLPAGDAGFEAAPTLGGFGAWAFALDDPLLSQFLATPAVPLVVLDGSGEVSMDFHVPSFASGGTGFGGETGWTFQFLDLFTFEMSSPYRLQVL